MSQKMEIFQPSTHLEQQTETNYASIQIGNQPAMNTSHITDPLLSPILEQNIQPPLNLEKKHQMNKPEEQMLQKQVKNELLKNQHNTTKVSPNRNLKTKKTAEQILENKLSSEQPLKILSVTPEELENFRSMLQDFNSQFF